MRTTLTLDDDVVALLEKIRRQRGGGFKEIVNDALRRGLDHLGAAEPRSRAYRIQTLDGGGSQLGDLDCVADALGVAEGEQHK